MTVERRHTSQENIEASRLKDLQLEVAYLNRKLRDIYDELGIVGHWHGHEHAVNEIKRLKEAGVPRDVKENVNTLVAIANRLRLSLEDQERK